MRCIQERFKRAKEEFNCLAKVSFRDEPLSVRCAATFMKPIGLAVAFTRAFITNSSESAESARSSENINALLQQQLTSMQDMNRGLERFSTQAKPFNLQLQAIYKL